MNRYQDTLDRLRFTPEQKQHMTDRLMAAAERPAPRRVLPFHRLAAAGVAAALVLSVGVAGATGALGEVGAAFSAIFGPSTQTEIMDKIGYPVGASDTDNGVTITADAIVGDTYSYAVVYTIQREDGKALVSDQLLARAPDPDDALPLAFQSYDAALQGYRGGSSGNMWFYDADPADSALQFVELRTQSEPLEPGLLTVRFQDLQVYGEDYATCTTLTEGSWKLSFQLAFEDASRTLPCGQTFTLNGAEATLNAVTLSPLSIQADYTVSWAGDTAMDWIEPLPMSITYTDGTTLDLSHAGGASAYGTGSVSCQKGMIFDQLHPLEEVASVTVGDVVIPVSQS
ncbi:DUF4179 domain-containing protein [Pseudoflavonifractor phocaeensis]|uniref:DUF4179 domain-containing protein n=1 Tax=Pseudoflavonifractor phocaeensis TaxID=1870988 RepID=UPI00195F1D84|nr:DUF4179 domain-containing protein [Pseudoflavonifractor phocaeensis]MBM6885081.1 DUF4179 domain-containing protein [Pseudoflavonifractor phocaeensis]